MITMRTSNEVISIISLGKKIGKANALIPRHLQWLLYRAALIVSDIVMTGLAFRLAYYFRFEASINFFDENAIVSIDYYRWLVLFSSLLWLFIFALNGLYHQQNLLGGTREYSRIFRSSTEGFLLIVIAGFLQPTLLIARGWLLMAWGFTFVFALVGRFLLRRAVYFLRLHGFFLTPAIIVGANQEGPLAG